MCGPSRGRIAIVVQRHDGCGLHRAGVLDVGERQERRVDGKQHPEDRSGQDER